MFSKYRKKCNFELCFIFKPVEGECHGRKISWKRDSGC